GVGVRFAHGCFDGDVAAAAAGGFGGVFGGVLGGVFGAACVPGLPGGDVFAGALLAALAFVRRAVGSGRGSTYTPRTGLTRVTVATFCLSKSIVIRFAVTWLIAGRRSAESLGGR